MYQRDILRKMWCQLPSKTFQPSILHMFWPRYCRKERNQRIFREHNHSMPLFAHRLYISPKRTKCTMVNLCRSRKCLVSTNYIYFPYSWNKYLADMLRSLY